MGKPEIGAGDVPIFIDGNQRALKPSVEACIELSSMAGGLNEVVRRINALHFETICAVVSAGLDLNPTQRKIIPKAVYEAGLFEICAPCIDFVHIVANGGRPIQDDEGSDKKPDPLDLSDTANITTV